MTAAATNSDREYVEPKWLRDHRRREARQMTPHETAEALNRLLAQRRKPVTVEVRGNTLGDALNDLVADSVPAVKRSEAREGEEERYAEFLRRWGLRFRRSIVAQSLVAWQMHVCRLPVFEPDPAGVSRVRAFQFATTRDATMIVAWFHELNVEERWDLCEEYRDQRSAGRSARRRQVNRGISSHRANPMS